MIAKKSLEGKRKPHQSRLAHCIFSVSAVCPHIKSGGPHRSIQTESNRSPTQPENLSISLPKTLPFDTDIFSRQVSRSVAQMREGKEKKREEKGKKSTSPLHLRTRP
jgi:hypothetical protein